MKLLADRAHRLPGHGPMTLLGDHLFADHVPELSKSLALEFVQAVQDENLKGIKVFGVLDRLRGFSISRQWFSMESCRECVAPSHL